MWNIEEKDKSMDVYLTYQINMHSQMLGFSNDNDALGHRTTQQRSIFLSNITTWIMRKT